MPNSRTTTGLPPGVVAGATGPRLLAALVEVGPVWLLVGLALLFAFVLNGSVLVVVLCLVVALGWAILVWAQRARRAAGPGMRLDSLQVVGLSDGRPLGWARVLVRWLVFAGLTVTVVGLVAMLIVMTRHPRRQGWHDLAANAVVIKERPSAPPRPKPAVAPKAPAKATASVATTPRPAVKKAAGSSAATAPAAGKGTTKTARCRRWSQPSPRRPSSSRPPGTAGDRRPRRGRDRPGRGRRGTLPPADADSTDALRRQGTAEAGGGGRRARDPHRVDAAAGRRSEGRRGRPGPVRAQPPAAGR